MIRLIHLAALILLAVTVFEPARADDSIAPERTLSFEMRSDILNETRRFSVRLPIGYAADPEARHHLVFVSDADWNFELVADTLDYLAFWGRIEPMIIVGAHNTSRNRDFVPRADANFPESGGGDLYLRHLREEALPLIEANVRSSGRRILFGHSFGGVLALNQLFTDPEVFDAHIALSPSTWVADRVMFERAEAAFESGRIDAGFLYMAVAEGDGGATVPDGAAFAALFEAAAPPGLDWRYEVLPRHNHFTVVGPALHNAIEALFPFWGFDAEMIEAGRTGGAGGVHAWFDAKQAALGWRFVPQAMELGLAGHALASGGDPGAAMAVFDRLEALYPERTDTVALRAQAQAAGGDRAGAVETLDRALELGERTGHWRNQMTRYRQLRDRLAEGG
ncbi:MAG: alpha/beta hydrolase-fold protein [Oceanicaulis sp.]